MASARSLRWRSSPSTPTSRPPGRRAAARTGRRSSNACPALVDGAFRNLTLRTNVFFVLSGLLLSLPFVRWAIDPERSRPRLRRFIGRRVRRIWPLYLLLMPLAAATVSIGSTSVQHVVTNAFLVQNLVPGAPHLLPPTWTLTVELGFYALLPVAMLLLAPPVRRLPRLSLRVAVVSLLPLSSIVLGCLVRRHPGVAVAGIEPRLTVLGHLDNFAAGMLSAIVIVAALDGSGRFAARIRSLPPLAWTTAGTVLVGWGLHARWETLAAGAPAAWWWVAPVALGVACWMSAVGLRPDRSLLARVVSAPLLTGLGQLAYGLFLWHYIVLHWFSVSGVTRDGGLGAVGVNFALVMAVTIPLAWGTWHLVELPMLDGRVRLPMPRLPAHALRIGRPAARPAPRLAVDDPLERLAMAPTVPEPRLLEPAAGATSRR